MKTQQTLLTLLENSSNKSFLFLGRETLFTADEIKRFLKKYHITYTNTYTDSVVVSIEHASLNPVEEDISNTVYDLAVPSFSLVEFETVMSEFINDDELLMGIKLSNDQNRIFRLLGNPHLSENLFLKLLSMYEWKVEEEDNREDRDTIMYTLKRYIDIKPNEADLLYSYLTLRRLAMEATNPKLLLVLIGFQNFEFLIRGKEKVTLREVIARNENLDKNLIKKLIGLRDKKVDVALAGNKTVGIDDLVYLLDKDRHDIYVALAFNTMISTEIFNRLLEKDTKVIQGLLFSQLIDSIRLQTIQKKVTDVAILATLGANTALEKNVIKTLLRYNDEALVCNLAENESLTSENLEMIYSKNIEESFSYLAVNPSSPIWLLESLYQSYDTQVVRCALAHNKSTPEAILRALFDRNDFEIYQHMASNASLPLELLDILKVDTRLQNELAKNDIFVKAYEIVLDYDKKAVQF